MTTKERMDCLRSHAMYCGLDDRALSMQLDAAMSIYDDDEDNEKLVKIMRSK